MRTLRRIFRAIIWAAAKRIDLLLRRYYWCVMDEKIAQGTVHKLGEDMRTAIATDAEAFELWQSLTPLGRNEFICWVEDAKQAKTR